MRRITLVPALAGLWLLGTPANASAHSEDVPASNLLTAWDPAFPALTAGAVVFVLFARGFLRLRARGRRDHAGLTHGGPFLVGLVVLTLALVSPLDAAADTYLLSAHVLQHVLIGDLAPALLVLGLRGPIAFFVLPASILSLIAGTHWLRRTLAFVFQPKPSFLIWALTLAVWHVPAIYEAALDRPWLHNVEHGSFLVAGLLVWSQLLDPTRRGALDLRGRILYAGALVATAHLFIHPVLFSADAVYAPYASEPHRLFGLSPVADQHWAGVVMSVEQAVTLGIFLLLLLRTTTRTTLQRMISRKAT